MKFVQMTCNRCNATMMLEKHDDYSSISCPYCGNGKGLLIESDRVKVARMKADTEQLKLTLRHQKHLDYMNEYRSRRKTQIVIICAFAVITLVLIGIFLHQDAGGWQTVSLP